MLVLERLDRAVERGARIVGACCGSTPTHLRAMADGMKDRLAA